MKSFYYIFTATLLLSTSTLNAGTLESADPEQIGTKLKRLQVQLNDAQGDLEKECIHEQMQHLNTLLELKVHPNIEKDFQTTLENSAISEYRYSKQLKYELFPDSKKVKAQKEEKKEEKIKLLKVPQLTLEHYCDSLVFGENPLEELAGHKGMWEVGDKSLSLFGAKLKGVHLPNYQFISTHPAPQRVPTEDDGTNNPFLLLTRDDPDTFGGRYAMCYYLQPRFFPHQKIEAPIFFIQKNVKVKAQKNVEVKSLQEERNEIKLLKSPQLTVEHYCDWLALGDNPFEELVAHNGIWEVGDKSLSMFGGMIQDVSLRDYADHFTSTHPEPQLVPREDDGTNNPFLLLTRDDPDTFGGRYAMCYYLQHKTNPREKIEAPIFFIQKALKEDAVEVKEEKVAKAPVKFWDEYQPENALSQDITKVKLRKAYRNTQYTANNATRMQEINPGEVYVDITKGSVWLLETDRLICRAGEKIRLSYDITIEDNGLIGMGWLNTKRNGKIGGITTYVRPGNHKGIYDLLIPQDETEISLLLSNHVRQESPLSNFTIHSFALTKL